MFMRVVPVQKAKAVTVHLFSPSLEGPTGRLCFSFNYRANTRKKIWLTVEFESSSSSEQVGKASTGNVRNWRKMKSWIGVTGPYRVRLNYPSCTTIKITHHASLLAYSDIIFSPTCFSLVSKSNSRIVKCS